MSTAVVLMVMGALIFFAHLSNRLYEWTRIPSVLLLILTGVVLGPLSGVVSTGNYLEMGKVFGAVALTFILFESGTNLRFSELASALGSCTLLTVFNFLVGAAVASVATHLLVGADWILSAYFGVIVAGISSAVVIPMVKQFKLSAGATTQLTLESALSDVLCIVIGLALLSAIQIGEFQVRVALLNTGESFGISLAAGLVVGLLWSTMLDRIRNLDNSIFLVLAFVFILYGAVEFMGWNGSLAVLAFGIMLGNAHMFGQTPLKRFISSERLLGTERNFFSEMVFVIQTYFFVYVGLSIKFGDPLLWGIGMLIVVLIIGLRPLGVWLFIRQRMPLKDYAIMSVLSPKGLVPAVLAGAPAYLGIELGDEALFAMGQKIESLAFAVVLISILLSSALVVILGTNPRAFGYPGLLFLHRALDGQSDNAGSLNDTGEVRTRSIDEALSESAGKADTNMVNPENEARTPSSQTGTIAYAEARIDASALPPNDAPAVPPNDASAVPPPAASETAESQGGAAGKSPMAPHPDNRPDDKQRET